MLPVAPWQLQLITSTFITSRRKPIKLLAPPPARRRFKATLEKEWGKDATHNRELASRALRTLVPGEEVASELEAIIGSPRLVKFFHKLGTMLGEDQLMVAGGPALASESPTTIDRQLRELEADPAKLKALTDQRNPMHKDVVAQRTRLIERLAAAQKRAGQ